MQSVVSTTGSVRGFKMKNGYLVVIIVLLMLVAGGLAYFIYMQTMGSSTNVSVQPQTYFYTIDGDLITNLKDDNRYIKINVEFEINDKKVEEELKEKNAVIRNAIIAILRNQTSNQVAGSEGQDKIRQLILSKVNAILQRGKVVNVYFDNFIVQ